MIICVCLNPAVDVTYQVDAVRPGTSHRVRGVRTRAGGKATNVARVLHQLGTSVSLLLPLGGRTGQEFAAEAGEAGLALVPVPIAEAVRRTVTVVDADDATVFNEPGPQVSAAEWAGLLEALRGAAGPGDLVVAAGSVPPGAPADAYAQVTRVAHAAGAAVLLDADGTALAAALPAGPDVVKPNVHEAADVLGRALGSTADVHRAAGELRARGAGAAVVSRGADGLVAVTADGAWAAWSSRRLAGNPTGAGDALTAALARGLAAGTPWPRLLPEAVATSAAAVVVDVAGEIDVSTRDRLRDEVTLTSL